MVATTATADGRAIAEVVVTRLVTRLHHSGDLASRDWETPPTRLGKLMISGGDRAAGKQVVV